MSTIDQDAEILKKLKESAQSGSTTTTFKKRMGGISRFRSLDEVNKSVGDKPTSIVSGGQTQTVTQTKIVVSTEAPEKITTSLAIEAKPQIVLVKTEEKLKPASPQIVTTKEIISNEPENRTGHIVQANECPDPLDKSEQLKSSKSDFSVHTTSSKLSDIRPEISPVTGHKKSEEIELKSVSQKIVPDLEKLESSTAESLFFSLSKNSKQLLEFIFKKCIEQGGNSSGSITLKEMGIYLDTGRSSTRWVYDGLVKLGIIEELASCRGPRSEKNIKIHHKMFSFMMFRTQAANKDYMSSEESSSVSSSIVSKLLNSINYTKNQTEHLPKPTKFEFKNLDFSALKPMTWVQINRSIRMQAEISLELEEVQQFIDRFPMWLLTLKGVQSPVGLFCTELKNFIEDGDSVVNSFQSAKEKKAEMEFYAETKKLQAQQELTEKFNNEVLAAKIDEQFNEWLSGLTDEKKLLFVPLDKHGHMKLGDSAHTASLKNYFKEVVFVL